jgi:hypothetical protein
MDAEDELRFMWQMNDGTQWKDSGGRSLQSHRSLYHDNESMNQGIKESRRFIVDFDGVCCTTTLPTGWHSSIKKEANGRKN